jgi:hypothetical protein
LPPVALAQKRSALGRANWRLQFFIALGITLLFDDLIGA